VHSGPEVGLQLATLAAMFLSITLIIAGVLLLSLVREISAAPAGWQGVDGFRFGSENSARETRRSGLARQGFARVNNSARLRRVAQHCTGADVRRLRRSAGAKQGAASLN